MSIIKLDQNLDPTFTRATTANYKDLSATAAASGVIRYENVVDNIVIDKEREWDAGAYTRCDASGNILSIENMRPTFDRNSSGWIDGTAYADDVPRFHGGVLEYGATNLFTYSTPTQTSPDAPANGDITFSSDFGGYNGISACVRYVDNGATRYCYPANTNAISGKKYTISCLVKMDDGSAPTVSNATGYDMAFVVGNAQLSHSTSPATVTLVSGTIYRISATVTAAASSSNNGLLKVATHSSKGFRATAFQMEENPSVTSYIATSGSIVNRITTYNKIGYLAEKGVTNLVTYSYDFSDASWANGNLSVSANAVYAPDGTLSADKLVENSSNGFHYVQKLNVFTASQPGTISIYAKAAERSNLYFSFNNIYANFNLISGIVTGTTGSPDATSIQYVGDGWYRCSISEASIVATDDNIQIGPASGTVNSYLGDGTSGIYIWGAQAEAKLIPTTYIPTTSATVTRNSDMLSIPAKDVVCSSGTIIVNLYNDGIDTTNENRILLSVTNGTTSTSGALYLYQILGGANRWRNYFGKADGTLQVISDGDSAISSGYHTVGLRWTTTNQQLWVDGAFLASGALTETPSFGASHTVNFGPETTTSNGFAGIPISEVNFFNTTLSDADMALYTAASGYAIPQRSETTYQIKFNNNLNFATSGVYVSEWFNMGVSGAILAASGVTATPSGTSLLTEYSVANSDSQTDASAYSTSIGNGKYARFRQTLVNDGTTAYVPSITSTTIYPNYNYGKAATIEESTVNLLTSPTVPATQDVTVTASGDYALSIYGTDSASGTCVIEHKKVETTTADFDAGTLSNVDGTGNALAMATAKAAPSFTRATSSTNYDGSTVTSGNLRYHLGKNLLTKNMSDVETNTTRFGGINGAEVISRDTTEFWQGVASLKVVTNSAAASMGIGVYPTAPYYPGVVPAGSTLTASTYVKGSGNLTMLCRAEYTDGTGTTNTANFTATSTWTRQSVSVTATAGKTIQYVRMSVYTNGAQTITYYVDGLQIEVGSSATDWVQGGPHAIMIEEASTNLLAANTENFNTNWSGYSGSSGTITSGQTDPFGGTSAYRVQTTSGSSTLKWYAGYGPGTNGLKYSHCIWIKNNDAANAMTVKSNIGSMSTTVNNSDGWVLVKQENITSDGVGIQHIQFQSAAAGTNVDVTCMWPQIEQKAYCTTYIAPGTTRNAEVLQVVPTNIFSDLNVGSAIFRVKLNNLTDIRGMLDVGGTGASGLLFSYRESSANFDIQYGTISGGAANLSATGTVVVDTWYNVGYKWGPTGAKIFVDGTLRAQRSNVPNIVGSGNYEFGSNEGTLRFLNGQLDTVALYREELTDAELASMTASSGSISLDRRTAYDLRFVNALTHGEGGYRLTTGQALDNIGTIGGSTIDWTATTPTGTSGIIETSIDNGSTWSTATDASTITGLTDGVSATSKTFVVRQTLLTEDTTSSPTLDDIEYRIVQKWMNTPNTYIKPVWTTVRLTPTNLTKFQLENKKYATSFYNGTRNDDKLTIPASGIINFASGAVVVRFYDDNQNLGSTLTRSRTMFSVTKDNSSSGVLYLYQITNGATPINVYISSDSATLQTATKNRTLSKGWHTMAARWGNGNISLWCDGAFEASGSFSSVPTMTTSHIITIGSDYNNGTGTGGYDISQVDIFSEALTDAEMIAYTAATGAVIPVGIKHSYQMKFEDSLVYGTCGKFTSRWQSAGGSNTNGTPWVTYSKVDSTPNSTSIVYQFKASDDQDDSDSWVTDITSITGRYIKVRFNLLSDDVDAATPTITSFTAYPEYS